ncbi:MAG: hypothetical protein J2P56_05350 [Verrucomicrobia bacterium]|nr:hypothetical protein [Verrucomicrobiota bacterium]
MKGFVSTLVALAANLSISSWADEPMRDPSPDGRFAMLLTEDQKEEGRVKIQLVEVSSRKVVLELAESGHPHSDDCKLLWSPDSQRVAFYEAHHRGGDTTIYFRNDSGFTESPLPELDNCATAAEKKELKGRGVHKFIEANTAPKEWLKSGALIVQNDQGWETTDGNLRGCTQVVTIAFDTKHKASIQRVADKKSKDY